MEHKKHDLYTTCENYWTDFPLPLDQYESHCKIIDKDYRITSKMNDIVSYPCKKCPFDSYIKIT